MIYHSLYLCWTCLWKYFVNVSYEMRWNKRIIVLYCIVLVILLNNKSHVILWYVLLIILHIRYRHLVYKWQFHSIFVVVIWHLKQAWSSCLSAGEYVANCKCASHSSCIHYSRIWMFFFFVTLLLSLTVFVIVLVCYFLPSFYACMICNGVARTLRKVRTSMGDYWLKQ